MARARLHIQVRGRVQGVFYRASARETAARLGLTGFVRNRPDGSVELVAEGDEDALRALVDWCKVGPPGAQVAAIDLRQEAARGEFASFRIVP